jgi:molybdopterin-guanine dinucleotide biosynthesis protein A
MSEPNVSAIILAGGKSRRMGRDKAFLEFDGKPLIAHVIERITRVCTDIIIVANDAPAYARFGLRVIGDVYPGKGSLGGIYSGLQAAHTPHVLAVACDMPFLNEALLRYLISLAPTADVIVPRARDLSSNVLRDTQRLRPLAKEFDLHPMHAVYSKNCLEPMHAQLLTDDLRIISFYNAVRVRVVEPEEVDQFDPQHLSFFNANTPADFEFAKSLRSAHPNDE